MSRLISDPSSAAWRDFRLDRVFTSETGDSPCARDGSGTFRARKLSPNDRAASPNDPEVSSNDRQVWPNDRQVSPLDEKVWPTHHSTLPGEEKTVRGEAEEEPRPPEGGTRR